MLLRRCTAVAASAATPPLSAAVPSIATRCRSQGLLAPLDLPRRISRSAPRASSLVTHRTFHASASREANWRRSSSTSGESGFNKSQALDANFVRFQLTRAQADGAYQAWAARQPLAPVSLSDLSSVHTVDQAYLPFYAFDCVVDTRYSGRIGFDSTDSYYNPATRRWETRTTTSWRPAPHDPNTYRSTYSSDLPRLQIYGAFKYKWDAVQTLKTPLSHVPVLTPREMSPKDFAGKEVDLFEMKIETAQGRVVDYIKQQEEAKGEEMLKDRYRADRAEVTLELTFRTLTIRRIYHPAYIYHLTHLGTNYEIMVNGVTGSIWGQFIYDGQKVGAVTFVGTNLLYIGALFMKTLLHASFLSYTLGVILPTFVSVFVGRYWSFVRTYIREARRVGDQEDDAKVKPGAYSWQQTANQQQTTGESDHDRTEQKYERTYRQQQQQYYGQYRAAPSTPPAKSFYEILGLKRDATLDDIRTAFRAKAFQYHPDVNKGNEAWANEKFRDVNEAYQTLRDPKKRAAYDATL